MSNQYNIKKGKKFNSEFVLKGNLGIVKNILLYDHPAVSKSKMATIANCQPVILWCNIHPLKITI